jgi:hypothetical protein
MDVQAGTFQSLMAPDQLAVANCSLLGEKRTWDMGLSSPIWEPKLVYFCGRISIRRTQSRGKSVTHLDLCEDFFSDVYYPPQVEFAVYALLVYAFLSSVMKRDKGKGSKHL